MPKLKALSAIIMDAESGQILLKKNCDLKLHPASTTKIMTALLLLENCDPDDILTAPPDVTKTKESSVHLMPGERITAKEMLYALMLRSANDGCHTVACHISGNESEFAKLMCKRATEIGCSNTTFRNPHGLTLSDHLTTARDLALIAREAMKNPLFAKVVKTEKHILQRSMNLKDTLLVNRDKWLPMDSRARGIKTGWTKPAGHCFVGCAEVGNLKIITVLLKSDQWVDDQKAIVNWAFDNFEKKKILGKDDIVGTMSVSKGTKEKVEVAAQADFYHVVPKGQDASTTIQWDEQPVQAPIAEGQILRTGNIMLGDVQVGTVKLKAVEAVKSQTILSIVSNPIGGAIVLFLSGSAWLLRIKSRKWGREL